MTDKHIAHQSGFLEKVEHGDVILADQALILEMTLVCMVLG